MPNSKNITNFVMAVLFLCSSCAVSLAKSENMIESLAALASRRSEEALQKKSVLSPAATYFVMVMLESVASVASKKILHEVTQSERWRDEKMPEGNPETKGWVELDTRWWVDEWIASSPQFISSCKHFRTKVIPSKLSDVVKSDPWSSLQAPYGGYVGSTESLLWTDVGFSPAFPGGLTKVPRSTTSSDNPRENSFSTPLLQTSIIEAWVSEDNGEVNWVMIPLEGGSSITISMGDPSANPTPKKSPVILFLPEIELTSTHSPLEVYDLKKVKDVLTSQRGFLESGFLSISEWMMRVSVKLKPHAGISVSSEVKPGDYRTPPVVVRIVRPFYFKINGSAGEVLFEGSVSREKLEEASVRRD